MNLKANYFLVIGFFLSSCSLHTGSFGVGNPMALSSSESLASINKYAESLQNRMDAKKADGSIYEDLDPLKTNSYKRIETIRGFKGNISAVPGGKAPTSVDDPNIPLENADIVQIFNQDDKPSGLLMDKISTLEAFYAHKQRFFDLSKLYANTPGMKIYKVFFTLWVEPERQNWWSYLYRWASIEGFRNYTKDYHADIMFKINQPGGCNLKIDPKSCIKVIRLEPEHEGTISDDYFASMNQSQLGLSGAWQEIAGNVALAERLRQAEIEQRKYPILRSVIESPNTNGEADFHFIVSPRQHVEERTFRIPLLMSPYSINPRIESVPYNVAAYFLVPNKKSNSILNLVATTCWRVYGNPERDCRENYVTNSAHHVGNAGAKESKKEIAINIYLPQ